MFSVLKKYCLAPVFSLTLLLMGCTNAPLEETKSFFEATVAVNSAASTLWNELSVAEKRAGQSRAQRGAGKYNFKVTDAYVFSTISDGPSAVVFRNALSLIQVYAEIQLALVDGSATQNRRGSIIKISADLAEIVGSTVPTAATTALSNIINRAIEASNVNEARRLILKGGPHLKSVINELRYATPSIFRILILEIRATPGNSTAEAKKLIQYKETVSNFIVLLDRLEMIFVRLEQAYQHPSSPISLSALAEATGALKAEVTVFKRAFAAIR